MLFSRVIRPLISSTHRVLLSGVSLTLFALLFVAPAHAARQCALIWSFSASMSSYLGFARSSSPDVPSCWRVDVFLSLRCYLSFVLRRPAYLVLGCLRFLLCLLLVVLLRRLLDGLLLRPFSPLLRVLLLRVRARVRARVVARVVALVHTFTAPTVTQTAILSLAASRRSVICVSKRSRLLQGLVRIPARLDLLWPPSLSRTLCGSSDCSLLQVLPRQILLVL
jgi:hypothetical protein